MDGVFYFLVGFQQTDLTVVAIACFLIATTNLVVAIACFLIATTTLVVAIACFLIATTNLVVAISFFVISTTGLFLFFVRQIHRNSGNFFKQSGSRLDLSVRSYEEDTFFSFSLVGF